MIKEHKKIKDDIKNSNNIYDIYIYIYNFLEGHISDLERSFEYDYQEEVQWKVQLNELTDNEDFSFSISNEYKEKIISLLPEENYNKLLAFIFTLFSYIDELTEQDDYTVKKNSSIEDDGTKKVEINPLNTNITYSVGKVYSYRRSFMERHTENKDKFKLDREVGETIERYQNNLVVLRNSFDDTKVKLYNITDHYANEKLRDSKNKYKVAIVPFNGYENILDINRFKRGKKEHISINGIEDEDEYVNLVYNILKNLSEHQVDIVIFPEMVITKKILRKIREVVKENRGKFGLIVCGTIWENRKNHSIIIGGNGKKLGEQIKLNRYRINSDIVEDIDVNSDNKIINIYDIEGFGRFGIAICADFINKAYFDSLKLSGVNICFVPAYTPSLSRFSNKAESLGNKNMGTVFVSNCCSKIKKSEISMAYIPKKKKGISYLKCLHKEDNKCNVNLCNSCFIIEPLSNKIKKDSIELDF